MKRVESRVAIFDYAADVPEASAADDHDFPFFIKRDGCWFYKGGAIKRKSMICLLASMLIRDASGHYSLESPATQGRVDIEDAPFVVSQMRWRGAGKSQELCFLTNADECILAGQDHPLRVVSGFPGTHPRLYLHVRDGKGALPLEARINRGTYYELLALAERGFIKGREVLGVWSGSVFFSLEEDVHQSLLPA